MAVAQSDGARRSNDFSRVNLTVIEGSLSQRVLKLPDANWLSFTVNEPLDREKSAFLADRLDSVTSPNDELPLNVSSLVPLGRESCTVRFP